MTTLKENILKNVGFNAIESDILLALSDVKEPQTVAQLNATTGKTPSSIYTACKNLESQNVIEYGKNASGTRTLKLRGNLRDAVSGVLIGKIEEVVEHL